MRLPIALHPAGGAPLDFSISGSLHIVDSSSSPNGGAGPGGAIFTQHLGIWDPSIIAGSTTPQALIDDIFFADCDRSGVLGQAWSGGDLTVGEVDLPSITTAVCARGSLTLTTGQEVLVVAGLQLPANRGGFADSSGIFTTRLGDGLTVEVKAQLAQGLASAVDRGAALSVPEPATWAMLIGGFGMVGGAVRRRAGGRSFPSEHGRSSTGLPPVERGGALSWFGLVGRPARASVQSRSFGALRYEHRNSMVDRAGGARDG